MRKYTYYCLLYYIKYYKAKNKDAMLRKYESHLILYDGAKNGLKRIGLNPTKTNPEEVRIEYQKLLQKRTALSEKYKNSERKRKELQHLQDTLTQYINPKDKQLSKSEKQNFQGL